MNSVRRDSRGTTVVELTVTMVITIVVATGIMIFMVSGLRNYSAASAKANLLGQAQTAVGRMSEDIMLAATADANNRVDDANSPIIGNPNSWASDADTLILATAVEDQSGNIVYADSVEYISHKNNIVYYLNSGKLYRRVLAAAVTGNKAKTTCPPAAATTSCPGDTLMLEDVSSFAVSYRDHLNQTVVPDEARSVEVSVTLQSKAYSSATVSYTTRTVFRND